MPNGCYLPLSAVASAPFGKTIKLRQRGQIVDITGWSAGLTLSDYPGGPTRLALSTMAPTAHGSSLQVVSAQALDCDGGALLDIEGDPIVLAALNVILEPADLAAVASAQTPDAPGDPVSLYYALTLTDLVPFARRWLFGPFTILPE